MTRFYMLYTDMLEMAALAMIMLMIAVLVMKNWQPGVSALRSLIQTRFAGEQQEQTIAGNIETLTRLQEEEWKILTDEEKMDVLQTVTNKRGSYCLLSRGLSCLSAQNRRCISSCRRKREGSSDLSEGSFIQQRI